MTISILRLDAGQKIARPFCRASNVDEAIELVGRALAALEAVSKGCKGIATLRYIESKCDDFYNEIDFCRLDTENEVAAFGTTKFYAFREV